MAAREETARIDLREPIREICERLGLTYNLVARLDMTPDELTAEVYTPQDGTPTGKPYVDLTTGEVVKETLTFQVRA